MAIGEAGDATAPRDEASAPQQSKLRQDFALISTLWLRDMLHLLRERSRWLGVVVQPLLFWMLLGSGMADSFKGPDGGSYLHFFYPGVLVMVMLFTAIFNTITVIEDRKSGFLQSVLVAPGSRLALVIGKVLGVTTMILVQAGLFVALAPLAGFAYSTINWLALFGVIVLAAVGLIHLTFIMAWLLPSTQAYHAIMSVVLIPLWVVSGAMFPPEASWVRYIARVNPMTYAVDGARAALGGSGNLALSLLVLGGFAAGTLALAAVATRRR